MDTKLLARLNHYVVTPEGCWEWQKAINSTTGYGAINIDGKHYTAHRAMWLALHGEIPPGQFICHTCDNRLCINPDHLFMGTPKDNAHDRMNKGRGSHGPAHGEATKKGHSPNFRAMQADRLRERMRRIHELQTKEAGVPVDWKFCPDCQTWMPRTEFHKNRARHDGLKPICRSCANEQTVRLRTTGHSAK